MTQRARGIGARWWSWAVVLVVTGSVVLGSAGIAEAGKDPGPGTTINPGSIKLDFPFMVYSPKKGGPGTVITIYEYCGVGGHADAGYGITGLPPGLPGESPSGTVLAPVTTLGPNDPKYPAGTHKAQVTVPVGTPPGTYTVFSNCFSYMGDPVFVGQLSGPFVVPGPPIHWGNFADLWIGTLGGNAGVFLHLVSDQAATFPAPAPAPTPTAPIPTTSTSTSTTSTTKAPSTTTTTCRRGTTCR